MWNEFGNSLLDRIERAFLRDDTTFLGKFSRKKWNTVIK